jgi:hypothetical protein|tara:strand:- start:700 stop:903 length:204 start_codon:yes stop_codon:yes gene_type:complete
MGRKPVLYEGTDSEESDKVRNFLRKQEIEYNLGFEDFSRFKGLPFSVVSEGMIYCCGLEAIERYFSR